MMVVLMKLSLSFLLLLQLPRQPLRFWLKETSGCCCDDDWRDGVVDTRDCCCVDCCCDDGDASTFASLFETTTYYYVYCCYGNDVVDVHGDVHFVLPSPLSGCETSKMSMERLLLATMQTLRMSQVPLRVPWSPLPGGLHRAPYSSTQIGRMPAHRRRCGGGDYGADQGRVANGCGADAVAVCCTSDGGCVAGRGSEMTTWTTKRYAVAMAATDSCRGRVWRSMTEGRPQLLWSRRSVWMMNSSNWG